MRNHTLLYLSLGLTAAAALAACWARASYVDLCRQQRIRAEQEAWREQLEAWLALGPEASLGASGLE